VSPEQEPAVLQLRHIRSTSFCAASKRRTGLIRLKTGIMTDRRARTAKLKLLLVLSVIPDNSCKKNHAID
jgi:hypothetical protein